MKFEFRLEKMLHFVQMREAVKKAEIAHLQNDLKILTERKDKLSSDAREIIDKQYQSLDTGLQSLHYSSQKVLMNIRETERLEGLILNAKERLEFRIQELQTLMRRRTGLEKLREKRFAEYKLVKNRKEQHAMDELFVLAKGKRT